MARTQNDHVARLAADDRLNEEFQTLLRDAAERREERAQVKNRQDGIAAREESAALLDLARRQRR